MSGQDRLGQWRIAARQRVPNLNGRLFAASCGYSTAVWREVPPEASIAGGAHPRHDFAGPRIPARGAPRTPGRESPSFAGKAEADNAAAVAGRQAALLAGGDIVQTDMR